MGADFKLRIAEMNMEYPIQLKTAVIKKTFFFENSQ